MNETSGEHTVYLNEYPKKERMCRSPLFFLSGETWNKIALNCQFRRGNAREREREKAFISTMRSLLYGKMA